MVFTANPPVSLSSSISVILSVVDIWSSKRLVTVMDDKDTGGFAVNTIEFVILSNDEIESQKRVLLTRPRALAKAIAETLIVDVRTVEIFQLIASNDGIKVGFTVYSVNYPIDKMLDKLFQDNVKLKLLINNYWALKQFPDISDFHQGQRAQNDTYDDNGMDDEEMDNPWDMLSTEEQGTVENMNELHPNHQDVMDGKDPKLSITSIGSYKSSFNESMASTNYVPLNKMNTLQKAEMIKNDPQLKNRVLSPTNTGDENQGEIEVIDTGYLSPMRLIPIASMSDDESMDIDEHEPVSEWKQYMDNLQNYAQCQTQLYKSHGISKDKPLHLLKDEDVDNGNDDEWVNYANNITKLLDDKLELEQRNNENTTNSVKSQWNLFMENIQKQMIVSVNDDYVELNGFAQNNDDNKISLEQLTTNGETVEMENNIVDVEDDTFANAGGYIE